MGCLFTGRDYWIKLELEQDDQLVSVLSSGYVSKNKRSCLVDTSLHPGNLWKQFTHTWTHGLVFFPITHPATKALAASTTALAQFTLMSGSFKPPCHCWVAKSDREAGRKRETLLNRVDCGIGICCVFFCKALAGRPATGLSESPWSNAEQGDVEEWKKTATMGFFAFVWTIN